MRRFDYLIRRLAKSRLNLLLVLVFFVLFIQALLAPGLFSYREAEILRIAESGYGRFQFNNSLGTDHLLPKFDQTEYLEDLNRYLSWLRTEFARAEPDRGDDAWLRYLQSQQGIHTRKLREVTGAASPARYYLAHYLEPILMAGEGGFPELLFPADANDPDWLAGFENYIEETLTAPSAGIRARAMNLREQLPLRLDHISAATLILDLRTTGKTLLLVVPFLAFLVLFSRPDRNLRRETPGLILEKTLAVFLYSAAALILIFGVLYLYLSLRHGNPEGAMHIVPPWGEDDPDTIRTLSRHMFQLAGMDLMFLVFASLLLTALWSAFQDPWAAGAGALGLMLLPSLVTSPSVSLDRLFTPFHYLNWEVRPQSPGFWRDLSLESYTAILVSPPSAVLTALLLGSIFLLLFTLASIRIRQMIKARSRQRMSRENPQIL